jgi:hypothetical protein
MDKLYRADGLRKEARQSDNLSANARLLEGVRAIILSNTSDASLEQLISSFRVRWLLLMARLMPRQASVRAGSERRLIAPFATSNLAELCNRRWRKARTPSIS